MEVITTLVSLAVSEAIKNLAKEMSSFLAKKVTEYYKDIPKKELVDSGMAFEDYLYKVRDMHSKSKTILYRDEKKELETFFEPPTLYKEETQLRRKPKSFFIPSENLEEIIKRSGHSKILITGTGGMGKTILLKHLCVNAIDSGYKIPIFISLRWFNDMEIREEPLENLIYDRLKVNGFKLDYEYFQYSLEGDKYVIFLDGYDEISNEKQSIITRKISDFTQQYADNHFIMTSRPVEQISCWNEYRLLELCPLNPSQAENLILKLAFDAVLKKKFINELRMGLYEKYKSFVSIPLTLSILFVTYVENTTMPETLPDFYETAFSTLLYRHDKLKEGYERVLKSKLGRQDFRAVFTRFCFETYFKDIYFFSETRLIEHISSATRKLERSIDPYAYKDDLVDVVCMLVHEGQDYSFLHRSFQEYFAAYYVSQMLDEKQTAFCAGFVNSQSFGFVKMREFLFMLKGIEPNKFDAILLLPILKKIHKAYVEADGDLITVAAKFYSIQGTYKINNQETYSIIYTDTIEPIYKDEYSLLSLFLYNEDIYQGDKNKDIELFISEEIIRIKDTIRRYDMHIGGIVMPVKSGITLKDCFRTIFIQLTVALNKYNELISLDLKKMNFNDMIDNY